MAFNDFLRKLTAQRGLNTCKALYEDLGEDKQLGVSLRNFQHVYNGKLSPSTKVFMGIFRQLNPTQYKDAVEGFFASFSAGESGSKQLQDYLQMHLEQAVEKSDDALWETPRPRMTYSESQLRFLATNSEAMRLHHLLLLNSFVPNAQLETRSEAVGYLLELDLAELKADGLHASKQIYNVPNIGDSKPSVVLASRYIRRIVDSYISEGGDDRQDLSFSLQMVKKSAAGGIREQMQSFKKWIQAYAIANEKDPEAQPFVFVSFGRLLDWNDF